MAVMALLREVNNGGFDQFFRNSSKRWAFFVKDALIHIGRKDAAKIAGRAVRALGVPDSAVALAPGLGESFEILDQKMRTPSARRDEIFQECDVAFCNRFFPSRAWALESARRRAASGAFSLGSYYCSSSARTRA